MSLFKAVIFDLDGTLVDSLADLADSVNEMLARHGYPLHSLEQYRYFVGNGSQKLVERALPPKQGAATIEAALSEYKEIYSTHYLQKTQPYAGIKELLEKLHSIGVPLAVCTNKHQEAAHNIVEALFGSNVFRYVSGDRPGCKRKPDSTEVLRLAALLGVSPSETAYLGDSRVDMQTAVQAGFLPIGVSWGFRPQAELLDNGAVMVLSEPLELMEKVQFEQQNEVKH